MTGAGLKERDSRTYLCFSKRIRYVARALRAPREDNERSGGSTELTVEARTRLPPHAEPFKGKTKDYDSDSAPPLSKPLARG